MSEGLKETTIAPVRTANVWLWFEICALWTQFYSITTTTSLMGTSWPDEKLSAFLQVRSCSTQQPSKTNCCVG